MKVAYVCMDPGVPIWGYRKGCSIHAQSILREFVRAGLQPVIFAANIMGEPPEDLRSLEVHSIPRLANADRGDLELACVAMNQELTQKLNAAGPFTMVYERHALWSSAAMRYSRDVDIPGLLEVNAPLIDEQVQYRELVHAALARQITRDAFSDASAILPVAEPIRAYLHVYGAHEAKIHVVANGVDPSRFSSTALRSIRAGSPFKIGFVGSLKPWHGLDVLMSAYEQFKRTHTGSRLLLIGDGPERESLQAWVRAHGMSGDVDFVGAVSPDRVAEILQTIDVAVAPYPELENFYFSPLKLYEYMAAGLPVIASDVGQVSDVIDDAQNGLLCRPGDAQALAVALLTLARDKPMAWRLGGAARSTIVARHTWRHVVEKILAIAASLPVAHQVAASAR